MMSAGVRGLLMAGATAFGLAVAGTAAGMTADPQTFDVPGMKGIVVDGDSSDWGEGGLYVLSLKPLGVDATTVSDFDARIRLGWDEKGILLLASVRDNDWLESESEATLWNRDSVEVYLLQQPGGDELCQWVISPGMSTNQSVLRWKMVDHRKDAALRSLPAPLEAASKRRNGQRCVIEARIPFSCLAVTPQEGVVVGFQIWFNDMDAPPGREPRHIAWFEGLRTFRITSNAHRLRLSGKAGPPETLYPTGRLDMRRNACRFYLTGGAELSGKKIEVFNGGELLATSSLAADRYGRASGEVFVPLPPFGKTYDLLTVKAGGEYATRLGITDYDWRRIQALYNVGLNMKPAVFSGAAFPAGAVGTPTAVEALVGPYKESIQYFDAAFRKVEAPATPGRYGALSTITTDSGATIHKTATLYWLGAGDPAVGEPVAGIAPEIAGAHAAEIAGALASRDAAAARVLAWLAGLKPGEEPGPYMNSAAAHDDLWWSALRRHIGGGIDGVYNHLTFLPADYDRDPAKAWPLFVYLHGAGMLGGSFEAFQREGLPPYFKDGSMPFVVAVPHNRVGPWNADWVRDMIDEVSARYRIDPERVYILGHSYGAKGVSSCLQSHPHRYAAAVRMGAGSGMGGLEALKSMPIWTFNGEHEQPAYIAGGQAMTDALNKMGGEARCTVVPGVGHGCEGVVMASEELRAWLLSHRRPMPSCMNP